MNEKPDYVRLTDAVLALATSLGAHVDRTRAHAMLEDVLEGEKGVWLAYRNGVITPEEAREKLLAESLTWMCIEGAIENDMGVELEESVVIGVAQALGTATTP